MDTIQFRVFKHLGIILGNLSDEINYFKNVCVCVFSHYH